MNERPFKIKIINYGEIRMGSPYNGCEIHLVNYDKIKLPNATWQDIYAWSEDSKKLVLVQWNLEKNEPGFHFFIIHIESGEFTRSHRIFGCVNSLVVREDKIIYNKFIYDKAKSSSGQLCCEVDEEYQMN